MRNMKVKLAAITIIAAALAIGGVKWASNSKSNELGAAISMARNSLDHFRHAVDHPNPGERAFFLRAKLSDSGSRENLWIRKVSTTPAGFRGELDEPPSLLKGVHIGDIIEVKSDDVVDWSILHTDQTVEGAFTQGLEPR